MTAVLFALRRPGTAALVGFALVAPEARYCSMRARGAERLDRRFATPRDWRAIETELVSLTSGPVLSQSALARVVAGRDLDLHYVTSETVEAAPADVAAALDARLRAQPLDEPAIRLRQTQLAPAASSNIHPTNEEELRRT